MENKRFIIVGKLLPYFGRLKVCDIDTMKIRKWQNELISYHDENGKPFSQTYLKTVNNQMSALMNHAAAHYHLSFNPCKAAGSMGKSKADEMNIWTQAQYERFSGAIQISIPDFLYNDIHKYISKLYGINNEDKIFYFTKFTLEKEIKQTSKKAGLHTIRAHDLRHSHASMLIELGFTPLKIAERLGHEAVKTTLDTYSHLYPDKD